MKAKQILLTLALLLTGMANSMWAQQANSVTLPTGDTWVRTDIANTNYGTNNTIEMQNNTNGTTDFYGVMQFSFDAPQPGYRVSSATLRLTTRFKKGDSKVNVYGLDAEVQDNSNYSGLSSAISTALEKSPIATFNINGYAQWAPTDAAVVNDNGGANYRAISAWQNTIDLTSYVQGLSSNSFAILLEKPYSQDNSSQVFSKEATAISLNDNSATFEASELVPQLTVTYEKVLAVVEEDGKTIYCTTLENAFDKITSSGTITLYDDITITDRCNINNKTINVVPAADGIVISSSLTNKILILGNGGNLTIGTDEHLLTIDGGGVTNSSNHVEGSGGKTTFKNVLFRNCTTSDNKGIVCHKSAGELHLNNVSFENCKTTSGRGIVFAGSTGLFLEGNITFTNCNEYNIYQENKKYLRVGDLSMTQAAPFTLYHEKASYGDISLSSATGGDKSALFNLMNEGLGVIKDPSHYTDHKITEAYEMTMNQYGASTLILPYEAKIPQGVNAYTLSYYGGNHVTATAEETTLPANTPVLLNAEAGQYKFTNNAIVEGATTGSGTHTSGALTGVYESTNVPSDSYILYASDTKPIGFYKANNNTVGANRAYLTAGGSDVKALAIEFGGADGINALSDGQEATYNAAIYNLAGQRVDRLTKGFYIVNGKKVLVK